MAVTRKRPVMFADPHSYCPGCGHGIVARLIAEVIEELGYTEKCILCSGVGCCANLTTDLNGPWIGDNIQCSHGRAASFATGAKIGAPDAAVIALQGDGDAYVIGLSETLNAAYRNENITVITVLNNNFAMTGGQMSWTTMPDQVTVTSPYGRNCDVTGLPIKAPEIVATFENVQYVARGAVTNAKEINKLKGYIKQAVQNQIDGKGYSMVEVISPCPTNWKMNLENSIKWMEAEVIPYYPLGVLKDKSAE